MSIVFVFVDVVVIVGLAEERDAEETKEECVVDDDDDDVVVVVVVGSFGMDRAIPSPQTAHVVK